MVTTRTTSLTLTYSTFSPHSCIYVFCVDLSKPIISLYSIDWLGFIMEMECVYCTVHSAFCPHSVFMCFVWIWEQTAIISLYNIDWLVFVTETECVYCAVRSTFCPQSVFMCFLWIWEQTALISLYSIDWLVFCNCTVQTECLYTVDVNLGLKLLNAFLCICECIIFLFNTAHVYA